ncbi:MAG: bifunctional UDP-N-acetylglucosamine pyrophosphorylase / Glucosamine-1-phosphate N-acetyltransferase [Elusimicrobia bacterium]|nr:MAG: bifunctional UDP-N-acetylglucosamine pyrophosphorylase / Glucosamine-1-phosphate N-acetyltransferase [Elusimicrobiota bacterium]KAF0157022.1 MAG: bifunctional UDP-N-acetylglucosamine pyrophosphorylase / Glucosamine-1-phosphate N-acetyltransferase [Elusimicrobiota bacterium]
MPEKKDLCALILAAGMGTRMKSALPKVLHELGDLPLAARVIKKVAALGPARIVVVVGHKGAMVKERLAAWLAKSPVGAEVRFVTQKSLTGSGRAVQEAVPEIKGFAHTLIICGDAPLFRPATLKKLSAFYRRNRPGCVVMTAELRNPGSYGRIIRGHGGSVKAIVEASDASPAELAVKEVNSGTYFFHTPALLKALKTLRPKGPKREYYLTDTLEAILAAGGRVLAVKAADETEIAGINSRRDLAGAYKMLNKRVIEELMDKGVTVKDPGATYIEEGVKIGPDTVIYPGVHIKGATVIGSGCRIGPSGVIEDCRIDDGCEVKFSCYLNGSRLRKDSVVGPFAHLRPGADIGPSAKVGNFSEVKKSRVGRGSKVPHLSYVGDTTMGEKVNVGAGTITCNYDGKNKHRTVIGDGVFIGSNTNLVAPVKLGKGSLIAAGSTITENVPAGALALARSRQVLKKRKGI